MPKGINQAFLSFAERDLDEHQKQQIMDSFESIASRTRQRSILHSLGTAPG